MDVGLLAKYLCDGGVTGSKEEIALSLLGSTSHTTDGSSYDLGRLADTLLKRGVDLPSLDKALGEILEAPGGGVFVEALKRGIQLSSGFSQTFFDQVAQSTVTKETKAVVKAMAEVGVRNDLTWKVIGLSVEPTVDLVDQAKDRVNVLTFIDRVSKQVLTELNGQTKTLAELRNDINTIAESFPASKV